MSLYDTDFYEWTHQQSALLRQGRLSELDIPNIVEEIESLGRSEKRQMRHHLQALLTQLAVWQILAGRQCLAWQLTIEEQRDALRDLLADNPSLAGTLLVVIALLWPRAVRRVRIVTGMYVPLPELCPWTTEQLLDPTFYPD